MKLTEAQEMILVWGPVTRSFLPRLREENSLVLVPEGRPYLTGLKHTIPLLQQENVPCVYCTDNMLGLLFYKQKIKKTILFYYTRVKNGLEADSGSLYAGLLSKLHRVPVEAVCNDEEKTAYIDRDAATFEGKDLTLEKHKNEYILEAKNEFVPWEVVSAGK